MKVYLTLENVDTTGGCGPIINRYCFITRELAAEYIDSKPGIMGRRLKWSEGKYLDWDIKEIEVYESIPKNI